ncbi:hypothetical protein BASA81_008998 [Batrachochytrium salamandrivorans]|nr:hypothetical protein BASA81_008998 [Batrachochytrium salamandrivorans]
MMTYGAPFEIISDRGKSFLAEGIDLFERENKIRHLATTPYHPQTNGMVERMHAMLGHGLTTLVHGKRDRWDEYLPQVLLALRTRTHAAPLDEIERMEENSEFIARNLEEVVKQDQLLMFEQRHSLKQCENVVALTKTLQITFSRSSGSY